MSDCSVYVYRALKKVDPEMGISSKGMAVVNSLVHDVLARLAAEAGRLARYNARKTVTARYVQTAVRLFLPLGLDKGAVAAGTEAVEAHRSRKLGEAAADAEDEEEEVEEEEAGGVEAEEQTAQASLAFPLARMKRAIKNETNMLVGAEATVYLAAVMGPACECARAQSMLRITPPHVQLAIRNDKSLGRFFADAVAPPTLPTGLAGAAGSLPGLPSLLPSLHVPPAAVPPTEAQAPVAEAVPGLRKALAAAGMERCDESSAFFANPPQAALPALAAAVAAFEISQDVDELKDTLTHTLRHFSTEEHC